MILVVTGSAGVGKTRVARALAKKYELKYIDVNALIKKNKLYDSYDRKFKSYVVDVGKLKKFLVDLVKKNKNLVLDSHLSQYLDKKYVDLCVIVKCDIKVLKKRLEKRRYSENKIRENLDAEIFDTCLVEATELGHKVKVINTSKGFKLEKLGRN
ncbi:MAG: adenylate kinase family protein [Candidatus Woesearchaeota archaeon]